MNTLIKYSVIDKRKSTQFRVKTYSGYKKLDVLKQFKKAILTGDVNNACMWAVELHISGHLQSILFELIMIMSININIANPHLPTWINTKYNTMKNICNSFNDKYIYETRNNQEMRNLLADIVIVITTSKKTGILSKKRLISDSAFMKENIRSHSVSKGIIIKDINKNDCKEVIFAANEIATHLRYTGNKYGINGALYWLDWLVKYEKTRGQIICYTREIEGIDSIYFGNWEWVIWSVIKNEIAHRGNIHAPIDNLFELYKINYNKVSRKKKIPIIAHALALLKCDVDWNLPIIHNTIARIRCCACINYIYKDIFNKNRINDIDEDIGKIYDEIKFASSEPNKTRIANKSIKEKGGFEDDNTKDELKTRMDYLDSLIFYKSENN